jgi:hypothetical protein
LSTVGDESWERGRGEERGEEAKRRRRGDGETGRSGAEGLKIEN